MKGSVSNRVIPKAFAFTHKLKGIGGPSSFQARFINVLNKNGIDVVYPSRLRDNVPAVIMVIVGTRRLLWLVTMKFRGAKVMHRLDGKNWHQSIRKDGIAKALKARIQDFIVYFIWKFVADEVIYQSNFVASVWRGGRKLKNNEHIIHNGVDIDEYKPKSFINGQALEFKIISVEGTVSGLPAEVILRSISSLSITVYGRVSPEIQKILDCCPIPRATFAGPVSRQIIRDALVPGSIFLNLETNPACPNAVIEALSSGVPVIGFDSGSLKELVGDAGVVLPYGSGNPWHLDPPDCRRINEAIFSICENYVEFSTKARLRAERMYSVDDIGRKYLSVVSRLSSKKAID